MADPGDERRSPRAKVLLSAVLQLDGRTVPVVLRDLSEHGALVEFDGSIAAESEILFCRNDLRVRGHVAWVRGKQAGVSFVRPLKRDVIMRYVARPTPPKPVDESLYRRPGFSRAR